MSFYTVKFRGQDEEVEVTKDSGYEADTNAHDIEWMFCDEGLHMIELTDEETQDIYEQIYKAIYESRIGEEPEI